MLPRRCAPWGASLHRWAAREAAPRASCVERARYGVGRPVTLERPIPLRRQDLARGKEASEAFNAHVKELMLSESPARCPFARRPSAGLSQAAAASAGPRVGSQSTSACTLVSASAARSLSRASRTARRTCRRTDERRDRQVPAAKGRRRRLLQQYPRHLRTRQTPT